MNNLQTTLSTPVIKNADGTSLITVAHLAALAVGSVGLYLLIPERKRKNLFK